MAFWAAPRLSNARRVAKSRPAGLLVFHQAPPTAKGFHFLSLEDASGMMNVIVKPDVYISYRRVLREAPLLLVKGTVQRQGNVVNLVAQHIDSLPVAVRT